MKKIWKSLQFRGKKTLQNVPQTKLGAVAQDPLVMHILEIWVDLSGPFCLLYQQYMIYYSYF